MPSVFVGPSGIRSGWRVLLFLLITLVLTVFLAIPLRLVVTRGSDASMFAQQALAATAVLCATFLLSRMETRAWWSYGLGAAGRWRNLTSGIAAGFTVLAGLMAALSAGGFYRIARGPLHGTEPTQWALYWAAVFLCVGLTEELVMRGYPLHTLARNMGFWPAAAIVAAIFGLGHLGNSGEAVLGILNAGVAGLVFAYSVRWTGSLWWAIGCHAAWNWAETFFFGVADSGIPARHSLLVGTPAGPEWLSGGAVGPEGSVLAAAALAVLAVAVRFTAAPHPAPELERQVIPPASEPGEIQPPASEESASRSTYSVGSDDTN
jgi:uncharacterized protein